MPADSTVLVIESDETTQRLLQHTLRSRYTVLTASCWSQAREIRGRAVVDAMVVNVNLTSEDHTGLDALCAEAGKTPCVLVVGSPDPSPLAHSRGRRPSLFAIKPVQLGELPHTLNDVIAHGQVQPNPPAAGEEPASILAESRAMRTVMGLIDRAALCDTPVLLIGESGTGKELLARALHNNGPRAPGPFVAVNCSAIPDTLLESELFGHKKGAFTDACEDKPGLFQLAARGTILLDEIGDMAPALQAKLLRVLQEKEVHPVGAAAPVPTDVRIITATHRDLATMTTEGRFRDDLLYRINVIEVLVPPLRERPDDLEPLVGYLLAKHGARLGKPECSVSSDVMAVLRRYNWPGNVRELENVIERALVLGAGTVVTLDDLPEGLRQQPLPSASPAAGQRLADVEREHIDRTLRAVAGNKAAAARVLGLDRKTLYRKLTQHRDALLGRLSRRR
jgi:two-component system response regulator HydG